MRRQWYNDSNAYICALASYGGCKDTKRDYFIQACVEKITNLNLQTDTCLSFKFPKYSEMNMDKYLP